MSPWPVVGHEWALDLLAQAIRVGRVRHAYLFTGPPQVGKTTVAQAVAQALVCERREAGDGTPCGTCSTCRRVPENRYPDVQVITATRNVIQIDQVRALLTDAAISPLEGSYKVFIITEIERATLPAANALLKTLEEPAPRVVLLLTSHRRDLVLPTILSRCQVVNLRPLPLAQIREALQTRWGVDEAEAELLSRLSAGRLGWAVTVHADPERQQMRGRRLDELAALLGEGYLGRLAYAEALSRSTDEIEATLSLWAGWWRDVLLVQHHLEDAVINLDRKAQLVQQAGNFRQDQVERALLDLMATLQRIRANVNPRLALDVLMLRLPKPIVA